MNINLTLFGQMITFGIFVWFTMSFVWPPIIQAIKDREKKIADGLAAAKKGEESLALAEHRANESKREAKAEAVEIIERANKRSQQLVDEAKVQAKDEGAALLAAANQEIDQAKGKARESLRQEVVQLALAGAEKILGGEVDAAKHEKMVEQFIQEIAKS